MSDLIVIGICGKPGSGKDTIGHHIDLYYHFQFKTIKKPIEETVRAIFDVDESIFYERDAREQPLKEWPGWTVRKLLQGVAQSLRDLVGEHLWAQAFCMRLDKHLELFPEQSRITITDIRTPGDVTYIRQHIQSKGGKFYLLMVRRPGYGATTSGGFANHKLESYDLSESCDHIFENDGTLDQLWEKVTVWMESIGFSRYQPQSAQEEEDMRMFEVINRTLALNEIPNETASHFSEEELETPVKEIDEISSFAYGKPISCSKKELNEAFALVESHSIAVNPDGIFVPDDFDREAFRTFADAAFISQGQCQTQR